MQIKLTASLGIGVPRLVKTRTQSFEVMGTGWVVTGVVVVVGVVIGVVVVAEVGIATGAVVGAEIAAGAVVVVVVGATGAVTTGVVVVTGAVTAVSAKSLLTYSFAFESNDPVSDKPTDF